MSGVFELRPSVAASGDESVAAGRDIGTVVGAGGIGSQRIDNATFLPPPPVLPDTPRAASVDSPAGLTNLPERPFLFIGRERELAFLNGEATARNNIVLHGLGGVGKSTLAAHWAADHAEHTPVWWITADSQAAADTGLALLATALHPALASRMQQGQLRDWAVQWLAAHEDWLVVLDNVADPADVKPLLAAATGGRFLITSRRATGWHGIAETIPLDVLTRDEAVDLFTEICDHVGEGVGEVCAELGFLPLAVEQAAAYCQETGTAPDDYLRLLAEFPADMYTAMAEGGDMERAVARVWRVTLDRLVGDPLAVTVLMSLAWYAPDDIPRTLLGPLGSPLAVRGAIGKLAAHSMVTPRGTSLLSLHRLVQAVARTPDPEDPHRTAAAVARSAETAVDCLAKSLPAHADDVAEWPMWRALLPHTEALADHTSPDTDSAEAAGLFSRMGEFAGHQGITSRARRLLSRGESGLVRHHGPDHPLSLTVRNRLMNLDSPPLDEALGHVARCERVLGPQHPETLTARYELVGSHLKVGDHEQAASLLAEVVEERSRTLGAGHPDTLQSRWSAVMVQLGRNPLDADVQDLVRLHEDCVRELGEKHPLTLTVRGTLPRMNGVGRHFFRMSVAIAEMLRNTEEGDDTRMTAAIERLREEIRPEEVQVWASEWLPRAEAHLVECETVLGQEHDDTIRARVELAQIHVHLECFDQALPIAEQAAEDAERHLGEDDPTTLFARVTLLALAMASKNVPQGLATLDWFVRMAVRRADGDPEALDRLRQSTDSVRESLASLVPPPGALPGAADPGPGD